MTLPTRFSAIPDIAYALLVPLRLIVANPTIFLLFSLPILALLVYSFEAVSPFAQHELEKGLSSLLSPMAIYRTNLALKLLLITAFIPIILFIAASPFTSVMRVGAPSLAQIYRSLISELKYSFLAVAYPSRMYLPIWIIFFFCFIWHNEIATQVKVSRDIVLFVIFLVASLLLLPMIISSIITATSFIHPIHTRSSWLELFKGRMFFVAIFTICIVCVNFGLYLLLAQSQLPQWLDTAALVFLFYYYFSVLSAISIKLLNDQLKRHNNSQQLRPNREHYP